MSCPFALLVLPRRPLLSEEEICSTYRKLAGTLHPDQAEGDTERFRELGEAAAILRDPARRLRELAGSGSSSNLPPQAAALFPQIAAVLQHADTLIEKHSVASSALSKALLSAPLKSLSLDLKASLLAVGTWRDSLEKELIRLDAAWPGVDRDEMDLVADSFAYATRWERELKERELALACME